MPASRALNDIGARPRGSRLHGHLESAWSVVADHPAVAAALVVGIAMRVLMANTYPFERGYDYQNHWDLIEWFRTHPLLSFPPPSFNRTAYHPPLYYMLGGLAGRVGLGARAMQLASLTLGCLRLVLLSIGLKLVLPAAPRARAIAIALAAVLPSALHLDAMVTQEPASNFLSTAGAVLILVVFRTENGRRRMGWAALLGLVAGLALMTKVSALALAATVVLAGLFDAMLPVDLGARARAGRLEAWGLAVVLMVLVGGWWYLRSQVVYGKAFLTGWDFNLSFRPIPPGLQDQPLLDRRSLGYVFGWSTDIYILPFYPSGIEPWPRFWPVLVTSAFVDFYGYGFASSVNPPETVNIARLSAAAGTVIAGLTVLAWLGLVLQTARRREAGRLAVLMLPAFGVLGQLAFAVQYPYDWEGPVKGLYYQFAAAPLFATFGLAVAWLWNRSVGRPLAVLALSSVAVVAAYSLYCQWM